MPRKKQPSIAVERALEQASQIDDSQQPAYGVISVKLTHTQHKKLDELSRRLALAKRFLLNLSIRYAIVYAQNKKQPVEMLKGFPKRFGSMQIEIEPTADTVMLLSENELMDKSKELVVFGLKLLYERLLRIR